MLKEEFGRKTSIIFPSCNLNLNTTQRTPTKQMTTINQFCSLHVLMESPKQTTSWVTSQNCLAYNIPRYVFVLGDRWVTYFPSFFVMTMAPPFVGSVIVLEVKYTPVTLKKKNIVCAWRQDCVTKVHEHDIMCLSKQWWQLMSDSNWNSCSTFKS